MPRPPIGGRGKIRHVHHDEREELRDIIGADVSRLRDGWTPDLDWHTLRREASMLRRLLVERSPGGDIRRLWRMDGRPGLPSVECPDLRASASELVFAAADVVELPGMSVGAMMLVEAAEPPTSDSDPFSSSWAARPLDRYVKGVSVVSERVLIRRADLIEFVANKLGGAHFDRTRDPAKRAAFGALDRLRNGVSVGDRDVVFAQVLAIAQTIAENDDIADLVNLPRVANKREQPFTQSSS